MIRLVRAPDGYEIWLSMDGGPSCTLIDKQWDVADAKMKVIRELLAAAIEVSHLVAQDGEELGSACGEKPLKVCICPITRVQKLYDVCCPRHGVTP